MPLVNAFSKAVVRDFSLEELKEAARLMRGYDLVALCAAGPGDAGGTLSMMEIVAALYLKVATHDPNNPEWPQRDRVLWSGGHKAPALYLGLAFAGYFPIEDVVTLREPYSPFRGHLHGRALPGVEFLTGFPAQALGMAVSRARSGKLDHEEHTVFCIMQEGGRQKAIRPIAMEAAQCELDNLVGILECGRGKDIVGVESVAHSYRSFGWEVLEIDGHDMRQVVSALHRAKNVPVLGKPTVILAKTVIGKGVSFMEDVAGWHGKSPSYGEMVRALDELGLQQTIAYDALLKSAQEYQRELAIEAEARSPSFAHEC